MSLETVDNKKLTPAQQNTVGENPVYDISIMSGGQQISSFGGDSVTIALPYTLKEGEDPAKVTVWYLNDQGELERLTCAYDPDTGLASFSTSHLSYYVVGYDQAAPPKNPFTDVQESDWFYNAVLFAVEKGLFKGTAETTFSPQIPMTRAMLVSVLHRLAGLPAVPYTGNFRDVVDVSGYAGPIAWASANGIASGYGGGLFGTNDSVTREQMAAMLYRYAEKQGYDVSASDDLRRFSDRDKVSAEAAMQWAVGARLIIGKGHDLLDPVGPATRAEVAAILQRFVQGFVK